MIVVGHRPYHLCTGRAMVEDEACWCGATYKVTERTEVKLSVEHVKPGGRVPLSWYEISIQDRRDLR